jgi:GMP synthase (glutamine-hydrolysing)
LTLAEVAGALRREAGDLIEAGLVVSEDALDSYAGLIEALGDDPDRTDLAWQLGVDKEVTDYSRRTIELRNFIEHLVKPMHQSRHRGHVVANSRPSA